MTPLIKVSNLSKTFSVRGKKLRALRSLNFTINRGETLGLVGESGCGKSTVAKAILGLHRPDSGTIIYKDRELSKSNIKSLRKEIQLIFQDPAASLNPRMTAEEIIREPLDIHKVYTPRERQNIVLELLSLVGLQPYHRSLYPHELSGGQKQRISIARALGLRPEFLILDEPISALDVSIQAQIVTLLNDLQRNFGLTYLFISHDLAMVKHLSNRVAVMYLGEIVEIAPTAELFANPRHPYTKALIDAIPIPDPEIEKRRKRILLHGEVPSLFTATPGCPFAGRCAHATARCLKEKPLLQGEEGKSAVSCFLYDLCTQTGQEAP